LVDANDIGAPEPPNSDEVVHDDDVRAPIPQQVDVLQGDPEEEVVYRRERNFD